MTISRMLYIDDSGAERDGLIVYGWIECRPERWRHALRTILQMRKGLYRDYLVPPARELHATEFINGRGRISTRDDVEDKTGSSPLWWCSGWILRWGCQALSSRAVSVSVPTSLPVSSTGVRRQRARTSRPR